MKGELELPPGFRFHPTDDELVNHYLIRKCSSLPIFAPIIAEIDLYKFDPWQLPEMALYGEKEWYFFSPRDRKYPNGSRPNRAAGSGYWKATGADKPIGKPTTLGIKKALVFYAGKAPRGVKTNWIMHEYRLANVDRSAAKRSSNSSSSSSSSNNNNNLRLDDWVLCRIYNKKGSIEKHFPMEQECLNYPEMDVAEDEKPNILFNAQAMMTVQQQQPSSLSTMNNDLPRLYDSSSSEEHVVSPEMKEVQSEAKWNELGSSSYNSGLDFQFNFMDGFQGDPFANQVQYQMEQLSSPLAPQDNNIFMYKPF